MEFGSDKTKEEVAQLFNSSDVMDKVIAARKSTKFGLEFAQELNEQLSHDFYEIRSYSARAIARIGYAEAIPKIIDLLQDEVEEVRFSAAESLSFFTDKQVIAPLLQCFADYSRETRRLATLALTKQESDYLEEEIRSHLESIEETDYMMETEESIIKIDVARGIMETLPHFPYSWREEFLRFGINSPDLEMVRLTAISIGRLEINSFLPKLLELRHHEDDDVRLGIVFALSNLEFDDKFDILLDYQNDPYEFIRQILATNLIQADANDQIEKIIEDIAKNEVSIVRSSLAQVLQDEKYLPILGFLLDDDNPFVRKEAAKSLGEIYTQRSLEILTSREEDDDLVQISIDNAIKSLENNV